MGTEVAINNCIYIYIYIFVYIYIYIIYDIYNIYIYIMYIYNIFPGKRPNSVGDWEDNV